MASAVGAAPTIPAVVDDNAAVAAAVVVVGSPSRRLRLRRRAPTILRPVSVFEPVVAKRRAGGLDLEIGGDVGGGCSRLAYLSFPRCGAGYQRSLK